MRLRLDFETSNRGTPRGGEALDRMRNDGIKFLSRVVREERWHERKDGTRAKVAREEGWHERK
jgi:hypothetical protein